MKAEIYNYKGWLAHSSHEILFRKLTQFLEESGFTILSVQDYHFEPQGYTSLWLLAESHLALHTFPEHNQSYVELSSCNEQMYHQFIQRFEELPLGLSSTQQLKSEPECVSC